jgi:uncharacterized protein
MAIHLLIDGYNYTKRTSLAGMFDPSDLDAIRDYLLDQLAEYKRERGAKVTVVFDAYAGIHLQRSRTNYKGVEVIYSGRDETADDVIREIVRKRPSGLVVVSSDRALIDEAKKHGITFITPVRLETSLAGEGVGLEAGPEGPKKGNPRRLPKSVRKARRAIGKI